MWEGWVGLYRRCTRARSGEKNDGSKECSSVPTVDHLDAWPDLLGGGGGGYIADGSKPLRYISFFEVITEFWRSRPFLNTEWSCWYR